MEPSSYSPYRWVAVTYNCFPIRFMAFKLTRRMAVCILNKQANKYTNSHKYGWTVPVKVGMLSLNG